MNIFESTDKGPKKLLNYIDPDDATLVKIFWGAPIFSVNQVYRAGDVCRPLVDNGYYYTCTKNGVSGSTEPAAWSQTAQTSGTAVFTAVPYDLWLLPEEYLQADGLVAASTWEVSDGVTITNPASNSYSTSVKVTAVPTGITSFTLTNQVRKSNGELLSRSFKYKVNEQ